MTRYGPMAALMLTFLACGSPPSSRPPPRPPPATPSAVEGWTAQFTGQAAGPYSGSRAIASMYNGGVVFVQLRSDANAPVDVVIWTASSAPPIGSGVIPPGTSAEVDFEAVFSETPNVSVETAIIDGTASQLKSGEPGDSRYPDRPLLKVTKITGDYVVGEVAGILWQALPDRDPAVTAPAYVQFTARICRT